MATLKVTGTREHRPEASELGRGLQKGRIVVKDAARVHATRAGASQVVLDGLLPDDVVEIELQDGLRLWMRVEDVPRDLARRSERGSAATDEIVIPPELTIGGATRSGGGWAIKALKVVGIDIAAQITDFVSTHVEGQLQPGPGLYRCSEADAARLTEPGSAEGRGPVLLFLHGTASSTSGSFAGLWTGQSGRLITSLFDFYDGRVFAYQHRTLTESPIENALALVRALGDRVGHDREVHLVSHSRGGLVGELLARGMRLGAAPFTPDELALFEGDARSRDRDALEQLSAALEEVHPRVTRFVRVACPARGTTLADRRLDRYVTVLVNLASLIPALRANPIYDALTNLLAGVLKKRTDPEDLPGIEAMMPTSPLVGMLNNPDVRTAADLHVLGGDLAGAGLFGRLKTLVTDFYYRDDHDVVVNTPAMLGGTERTAPIRYWIDTGDQVTHFHYFSRDDTARRLASALTGSSAEFRTLEVRPSAVTSADYRKRAALSKPVVFVLPGIMGSQLTVDDQPVWLSVAALARGGMSRLKGADGIKASGLLRDGYAALCEHLKGTHEVVPFPYDWRRPLDESAGQLRAAIEAILPLAEAARQPVRLLAHSMGGLVVRTMLADPGGQETWTRMCQHPGARFVMLGTPNGGSHAIPAMLMGRDALVRKLALVDLRSSHAELLATIAGFDGVLNLLPHGGSTDYFDRATWERLLHLDAPEIRGLFGSKVATSKSAGFRWTVPSAAALEKARALATALQASPLDPRRVAYVAGMAPETACDLVIDERAPAGRRVTVMATSAGDGRVLWETGIPQGVRTFYMDTVHGDLANDRRHFSAIVDLLSGGTTSRLPTTPPARSRDAAQVFELAEPLPAMIPDDEELVASALGGHREKAELEPDAARIAIRVVHDNLTNARFPVLVSHYRHDVIVAAEAYLDKRLDNRLSELLRMELYPGPINTGVVVLNDTSPGSLAVHPGAIVAGLGDVGELTPGGLTSTLAHALTMYGADCVGRARRRQQREGVLAGSVVEAPITAILVGSGEGGLSLADSIRALLRAVLHANQRLTGGLARSESGPDRLVARIGEVEIFELYEDRSIEALHQLRQLASAPEFEDFVVDELLVDGKEGRRRARFDQADGWWQRIRIVSEEDGTLCFEALTHAARVPMRLRPTQRGLVDGFVQRALETTADDPQLGQTLFELLVPNDFKPYAPDRRKLALMLNEGAAAIPWELIQDGFDRSPEPLSVSSAMIRQLRVDGERLQVLRAPGATALVVGNPIVADSRFPSLAGAAAEAATVASLLSDEGYDVQLLLEEAAHPMAVLTAVHEQPWRILHLAAHGVFEFDRADGHAPVSGLVLDDGLFFTAAEADQLRHVPELVFINCCHLGQTRGDVSPRASYHRLAANLATQFIKMGARAVVAAGWAVDDAAAKTFARSFYECMLRGDGFGDAVLQARSDTYQLHAQSNTWGAYQCYGDPSFSFLTGRSSRREETFVAPEELCVWFEQQTRAARGRGGEAAEVIRELTERAEAAPQVWWTSAKLCALAGDAFAAAGDFESAIGYYQRVLGLERANAPLAAVEQLASCRVRLAGSLLLQTPPDADRAEAFLKEAETTLRHLLGLGQTSERWSLLGSVMKRRALLPGVDAASRRAALGEMRDAYKAAHALLRDRGIDDGYPLANQVAAEIVLGWRGRTDAPSPAARAAIAELEQLAGTLAGTRTDTFSLSAAADTLLLDALLHRRVDDPTWARIADAFATMLSRGSTAQVRDSILTQLRFYQQLARTEFPKADRDVLIERLEGLVSRVSG